MAVPTPPDLTVNLDELRDSMVAGVDREALRYQVFAADRLVASLGSPGEGRFLDVCAGTGVLTLAIAQLVRPAGRVTAIDTAEKLLARLDEKIAKFSLTNVDVHVMPPAPLEFRRDYFRQIFCGLGLFWQRDVEGTLREWKRVLAPGGEIGVTVFTTEAFQPYADQLCKQLASCRDHTVELPWLKLGDDRQIRAHLDTAGFTDVVITKEALGYHLPNVEAWWEVVMNSPVRILFKGLSADGLAQVRNRHLEEVRDRITGDGLWLNVPVWLVRARKPA